MFPTLRAPRRPQFDTPRARRPRTFSASVEAVEDRMLLTSLAAVNYSGGGTTHSATFALGFDNTVSMSRDGGPFVNLGGYCKTIAAGLDSAGNPEVYTISSDNALWSNDNGAGWVYRAGAVKEIAAGPNNTAYAIGSDDALWLNTGGTSWKSQGGWIKSLTVGADNYGRPEVYGISKDNAVWSNDNGAGWVSRGGWAKAISATVKNAVFAVASDNSVYLNQSGTNWQPLGGSVKSIAAGPDGWNNPELYAVGGDNAAYYNDNAAGYVRINSYVTELAPATNSTLFVRGGSVEQVFVSHGGRAFDAAGSVKLANPAAATAYSPAPASAPLFRNGTPSYLDMQQGATGDCWLDASLAEVALRNPQAIKGMFTYQGTTVDNGATVGLYLVRLIGPNGIPGYFQVDTALPSGGAYYDRVTNPLGTQSLWSALVEKAYAEANALGMVSTSSPNQGSYAALNNGFVSWAFQAITGNGGSEVAINPTNAASAWNAGKYVVLRTTTPASSLIVSSHCYAMVGYDAAAGNPFKLFNPWGTQSDGYAPGQTGKIYGLFNANSAFLSQNFATQAITGTVNPTLPVVPTEHPTVAIDFTAAKTRKLTAGHGTPRLSLVVDYTVSPTEASSPLRRVS